MNIVSLFGRWLGIIAIIVVLMVGFYLFNLNSYRAQPARTESEQALIASTPSPTSSQARGSEQDPQWQTFRYPEAPRRPLTTDRDEQPTFSLQYPPQWSAQTRVNVDNRTLLLVTFSPLAALHPQSAALLVPNPVFTVQVTSRPYLIELEIAGNNVGGDDERVVVNGTVGRRFRGAENPTGTPITVVVVPHGPNTFVLKGVLARDGSDYTRTVERMISTFSFE